MTNFITPTAATLRACTLPTQRSPFMLSADAWRLPTGDPRPVRIRVESAYGLTSAHNSILTAQPALVPATVVAAHGGVDAKQAAPPRGVPR